MNLILIILLGNKIMQKLRKRYEINNIYRDILGNIMIIFLWKQIIVKIFLDNKIYKFNRGSNRNEENYISLNITIHIFKYIFSIGRLAVVKS